MSKLIEAEVPHRCETPRFLFDRAPYPLRTIWICDCGKAWFIGHDALGYRAWLPMHWYHFRLKRRMKAAGDD